MYCNNVASGSHVRFQLKNAVCPETTELLACVTDRLEVKGRVIFLSDSAEKKDHFAVVEVNGLTTPLVVPVTAVEFSENSLPENITPK